MIIASGFEDNQDKPDNERKFITFNTSGDKKEENALDYNELKLQAELYNKRMKIKL